MDSQAAEGSTTKARCTRRNRTSDSKEADACDGVRDGAEERAVKELTEFYDLLKQTAPEDVRKIDERLRNKVLSAEALLEGLDSKVAEKL